MRTIEIKGTNGSLSAYFPTENDVRELMVGAMAPNCFGKMAPVTRITAMRQDLAGKWFVCYYTAWGEGADISGSLKQDEILRTVAMSNHFTSAAIDSAERMARHQIANRIEELAYRGTAFNAKGELVNVIVPIR